MKVVCSNRAELAEHTRQQILDAALRVFAARGYAGSSTQAIVKAAQVAKPALYYHFGNKEGLFRAVADRTENQLLKLILEITGGALNVPDQLVEISAAMFQFACDHPAAMGLAADLWSEAREHGPSRRHCLGTTHHRLAVIQKVMEQGVIERTIRDQFGSQHLAVSFLGVLHSHILFRLANPRNALTRHTAEQAVSLFLEGAANGKSGISAPVQRGRRAALRANHG